MAIIVRQAQIERTINVNMACQTIMGKIYKMKSSKQTESSSKDIILLDIVINIFLNIGIYILKK